MGNFVAGQCKRFGLRSVSEELFLSFFSYSTPDFYSAAEWPQVKSAQPMIWWGNHSLHRLSLHFNQRKGERWKTRGRRDSPTRHLGRGERFFFVLFLSGEKNTPPRDTPPRSDGNDFHIWPLCMSFLLADRTFKADEFKFRSCLDENRFLGNGSTPARFAERVPENEAGGGGCHDFSFVNSSANRFGLDINTRLDFFLFPPGRAEMRVINSSIHLTRVAGPADISSHVIGGTIIKSATLKQSLCEHYSCNDDEFGHAWRRKWRAVFRNEPIIRREVHFIFAPFSGV